MQILKRDLDKPISFKEKMSNFVQNLRNNIQNIPLDDDELTDLLLSACRVNDFEVISYQGKKMFLNEDRVLSWLKEKILPNTVVLKLNDEDIIRLLIFCIEITYQMFSGGTKATITAKGFRERKRTFEAILVDQFVGKLGEVVIKKFLEKRFPVKIELDWEISRQIDRYRNDIINAKKKVSIKSTPNLAGIWAESDIGYEYGIMVKCSIPHAVILQFFIEVCGFSRLVDFAEEKIPSDDNLFKDYLAEIRKRIGHYKCGEIQTDLKGIVCGYFKTRKCLLKPKGVKLEYLGEVREERYLLKIKDLKWKEKDWEKFLKEIELLQISPMQV
jgi:hypothetical protein